MNDLDPDPGCAPNWLRRLDAATWVVDGEGRMRDASPKALALLGLEGVDVRGRPCHELVEGVDESGAPVCVRECEPRRAMAAGGQLQPFLMRRTAARAAEWILVFPIPVEDPADEGPPLLVHLAYPMSRYRRIQAYWQGVVDDDVAEHAPPRRVLSAREQQILERLGRGEDLKRIARELFVSYATVRNHVQHILEKLRVHSMQEAVGLHLLLDGEVGEGSGRPG